MPPMNRMQNQPTVVSDSQQVIRQDGYVIFERTIKTQLRVTKETFEQQLAAIVKTETDMASKKSEIMTHIALIDESAQAPE